MNSSVWAVQQQQQRLLSRSGPLPPLSTGCKFKSTWHPLLSRHYGRGGAHMQLRTPPIGVCVCVGWGGGCESDRMRNKVNETKRGRCRWRKWEWGKPEWQRHSLFTCKILKAHSTDLKSLLLRAGRKRQNRTIKIRAAEPDLSPLLWLKLQKHWILHFPQCISIFSLISVNLFNTFLTTDTRGLRCFNCFPVSSKDYNTHKPQLSLLLRGSWVRAAVQCLFYVKIKWLRILSSVIGYWC